VKCNVKVAAGVCGFTTRIAADAPDDEMVTLSIESDCEKIGALAEALNGTPIDAYEEIHRGFDGTVMSAVRTGLSGCCAGCVVPSGIFKAVQVAARVALPKAIAIEFEGQ
jgi:hypothetical protein